MKLSDITKAAASSTNDWGYIGVNAPTTLSRALRKLQNEIDPEDLYDEPGYGIESDHHCTVAYGLDKLNLTRLKLIFAMATPITFRIEDVSTFDGWDDSDYIVLKYAVKSGELSTLRRRIKEAFPLPGQTFNRYNPHVTIAYLKKDADVEKYKKKFKELVGKSYTSTKAVFEPKGKKRTFNINIGRDKTSVVKKADISLDIDEGDTLLTGRFKNKPMTVKDIGTDEKGQPTVNSKKLLAVRIKKLMPEKKAAINQDQIREAARRYTSQYEQAAEELDRQMPEDERLNMDKIAEANLGRSWLKGFSDMCRLNGMSPFELL